MVTVLGVEQMESKMLYMDEERHSDEQGDDNEVQYDPAHETPIFACRRDPTWTSLDFDQCQELTEWYEPDTWSVLDRDHTIQVLGDAKEKAITQCLIDAFDKAKTLHEWGKCDEGNRNESCAIDWPFVLGHYTHAYHGKQDTVMVHYIFGGTTT
jgi:hypothetical protein